ncbi:MAG: TonB-dependent receptor domain-containing protein, partial [Candidatus Acidiferrales bacterium]
MSTYWRAAAKLGLGIAVLALQAAYGQTFSSSIGGVVTDPTGASVAKAQVQLKNMGTNDVREASSQRNGAYQFSNLIPGTYQITVTAPNFQKYVKTNLVLQANVAATVNVPLQLGTTQQTVQVTAGAVLLDTRNANNQVTLNSALIQALPNSTRNPLNFVFAVAGTTQAPGGQTQSYGTLDQMSSNFGINGGRTGEAEILIDGAPSQAADWGGLMVSPLQDSVQEEQIVHNTYSAQYERGGSGIVSLITKGGTNQFHGEAYDYVQNAVLNANSWYNNEFGFPRADFSQNQFGGNFSGPLVKSWNLFFFVGYEGLRQPNTQTTLLTVPTDAERSGDFSSTLNADGTPDLIYNPFSSTPLDDSGADYTRTQLPGNKIPSNLLDPVGQKIVNLYPKANRPGEGPNHQNNYSASGSGNWVNDKIDTRIDWAQNSVHRLFVRFSDRIRQDQVFSCFFCNGADQGVNQYNNGFQIVLNDTVTPSATWVINSYVSYSRWLEQHISQGYGKADAATIGLPVSDFQAPILPAIYPDDGPYTYLGSGDFEEYPRDSALAAINFTKVLGNHTLQFGFNFDDQVVNNISENAGSFDFSSAQTSCDPSPGGPCMALNYGSTESGNVIASMLMGTASGGGQGINISPAMSLHSYGMYIQDGWHATKKLTINAGLRYENQRPATERFNRLMYFNSGIANPIGQEISPLYGESIKQVFGGQMLGGFQYADASDSQYGRYAWPPNNLDFAPRLGIAYQLTDKLVLRAGAGMFYLPPSAMISFDNPGQFYGFSSSTNYNATQDNGFTPLSLISNPFPQGINQPQGSSQGLLTLVGNGLGQIWPVAPHPTPYTEQWSFDIQYRVSTHSVFEIGYNGNRGRKLLYGNPNLDADQMPDKYLSLGPKLDSQVPNPFYGVADPSTYFGSVQTIAYNEMLRPYPEFTYLQWTRSLPGARSAFDALEAKYNYRF